MSQGLLPSLAANTTATTKSTGRCLALWFPSWPVTAWALATGEDPSQQVAVVSRNRVIACSAAARAEGVLLGQRRREAQSRCAELKVIPVDEARDSLEFAPLVTAVEQLSPGVQVITPGTCVLLSSGLANYVGSEAEAAEVLLERIVTDFGISDGRIGIADGMFAAIQAARSAAPVRLVPAGTAPTFLAPLPVARLGDEGLSALLPRLGIHTLGDFAALSTEAVRDRFGLLGVRLHRQARGVDAAVVQPRVPSADFVRKLEFEPPLARIDQVAFTAKATVEEFIATIADAGLVCTELRIEVTGDRDEFVARAWGTPGVFDAAAVIDRIRWQLQAAVGAELQSAVTGLCLEPLVLDELADHTPGLFGQGTSEKLNHVLSRVQAMLGHEGVLTPQLGGGRWLAERQVLVPWGDRPQQSSGAGELAPADRPWPGRLPDPLPATVFPELLPVRLLDGEAAVRVSQRGQLRGIPTRLVADQDSLTVIGWAGPWPIEERAWDPQRHRQGYRFQVVDGLGTAWLLLLSGDRWWAEGRYD